MSKLAYRPEIDGLRAIAVLIVLFFHAGLGFSGGYVGVDVFFVISGFLITGLVLKDLDAGQFRLVDFWERRIRRITPALTVMVVATLAVGALILLPEDYIELAKSGLAQPVMAANFHFRDSTGYFAGPAELKPLLHTWSLAVEEQFYLILPVLLIACRRFSRKGLTWLLSGIAVASFALSVWGTYAFIDSTFYLLPTRAWELLIGSLLALLLPMVSLSPRSGAVLSWGGLCGILVASLWYDGSTLFPGLNALLPCLAAGSFIAGNTAGLTAGGRFMASKPVVLIGRMSYSLYLWHWPVLAFMRHLGGVDLPLSMRLVAVGLSVALAWLSWKFVETPLRQPAALPRRWVFGLATAVSVVILCGSWSVVQAKGFRGRFSEEVLEVLASGDMADQFQSESIKPIGRELQHGEQGSFLLWGDSHAQAIHELIHELAVEQGLAGYYANRAGTIPIPGTREEWSDPSIVDWKESVVGFIKEQKIQHVILASRWSMYIDDLRGKSKTLLVDNTTQGKASSESARAVFDAHLRNLLADLKAGGVTVWLMQQVPEQPMIDASAQLARCLMYNWKETPTGASLEHHREHQAQVSAIFASLPQDQVRILDPTAYCFDEKGHARLWEGKLSYYFDDDHLSRHGARGLLMPMLQPVIREISVTTSVARQVPAVAPTRVGLADPGDSVIR